MKELAVQPLSQEVFKKYGSFSDLLNPSTEKLGPPPVEFFRDMEQITIGQSNQPSFSVTRVTPRPLIVEKFEYHNLSGEAILPLNGDIIIHLAPAGRSGGVPYDRIQAFLIPCGTLVTIRPGVWHQAPFALAGDTVSVMVVLPERTYENDCVVVMFPEEEKCILQVSEYSK